MKNEQAPKPARDRIEILEKIERYEEEGLFDKDVENDPPTRPLEPGEVDYTGKKLTTRLATRFANHMAYRYFEGCLRRGEFVLRAVRGIENYIAVKDGGVILTANHFSVYDNYAVFKAIRPYLEGDLYKIIREGNYTSFGGRYGFFFRHCNTIPLGSRLSTIREMMEGISALLARGEKILIYPEQGMWWNYRKPRPLKLGAFQFAVKNNVPILPLFITTEETETIGKDGFPVLAYTVHILPALYPDKEKGVGERARALCLENYRLWRETYESFYGKPLVYTTKKDVDACSI